MMMAMPNTSASPSSRLTASFSSSTRHSNKRITNINNNNRRKSLPSLSSSSSNITPQITSDEHQMPHYTESTPEQAEQALAHVDSLKFFLATAPTNWKKGQVIRRYMLPNGEPVSCVLWNDLYYITGTDIMRCLNFRFQAFGRPVVNAKKFEESVFSNLRNLKAGTNATLEEPKSAFLEFLHQHDCIRTQKKQKVFYWYAVPHDLLFIDVLERDFKRERAGLEPVTKAVKEPALSFRYDLSKSLQEKLQDLNAEYTMKPDFSPQKLPQGSEKEDNQNSYGLSNPASDTQCRAVGGFKAIVEGGEGCRVQSPLSCRTPVSMLVSQPNAIGGADPRSDILFSSDLGSSDLGDLNTSCPSFSSKFPSSDSMFPSSYSLEEITGEAGDPSTHSVLNSSPLATILDAGDGSKLEPSTDDSATYRTMFQTTPEGQDSEQRVIQPDSRAMMNSPLLAEGGAFPATFWWMSNETVPVPLGELGFVGTSTAATSECIQSMQGDDNVAADIPSELDAPDAPGTQTLSTNEEAMPATSTTLNPPSSNVTLPEATSISSIPREPEMMSADSGKTRLFVDSGLETTSQIDTTGMYDYNATFDFTRLDGDTGISSSDFETRNSGTTPSQGHTPRTFASHGGEDFGQHSGLSSSDIEVGSSEGINTAPSLSNQGRLNRQSSISSRSSHCSHLNSRAGTPSRFEGNSSSKPGSNYRIHTCPVASCRRIFKRSEHLRRHVRTHTQERPYICTVCQKGFSRSDNLSQHRRTHRVS